uniref:Intraflagellar transport 74 n=1 Tax=Cyprinus carpio TaxID=7962 RepID=A0A8C1VM23_CYPCA
FTFQTTMASQRPVSRGFFGPVSGRPPTALRPPQTAVRVSTVMIPGSTRPGSRAGTVASPGVLSAQIKVADRPVTQQGLRGMKMAMKGPQRQILDKSYYLGLLRSKISELTMESSKLQKDIDTFSQENSVYLSYEKRAEVLAGEIKDLQGQLADYNMLVDKLNTNNEMDEVVNDIIMLKAQNDREAQSMDVIFTKRREKEDMIRAVEGDIVQEKQAALNIIQKMSADKQAKYTGMKATSEELMQELDSLQEELDTLMSRNRCCYKHSHSCVLCLQDLVHSQAKLKAVVLHEKLLELENRRNLVDAHYCTENSHVLFAIFISVYQIYLLSEVREKISHLTEEMRQLDADMEEHQGLNKWPCVDYLIDELIMCVLTAYLNSFEENKSQEQQRIRDAQSSIVALLEHSSKNINHLQELSAVTAQELRSMQEDLSFKETEMQKSQSTAKGLSSESERLRQDLLKVEQLEGKVSAELQTLRDQLKLMMQEIHTYRDQDTLRAAGEDRKKSTRLQEDRLTLTQRKDTQKKMIHNMNEEYQFLKERLQENETHVELTNMERKWQHLEQNNFVMKEFIVSKVVESHYRPVMKNVNKQLLEYNKILVDTLQRN